MRVLYFGMPVPFSTPPLQRLIESRHEVMAVVLPREQEGRGKQEALPPDAFILHPSAFSLAASGLPTIPVESLKDTDTLDLLSGLRPDVICVACFPHIFPPNLLELPPHGCLNLHPSLLPRYRGPAPLFWQFRQGETHTGVTLHFMDAGADTGDVALLRHIPFEDGLSGEAADALCAEAGAGLLIEALDMLANDSCPRISQDVLGVEPSTAPWPKDKDFEISTAWPARRAFNFVRGTAHWGRTYDIMLEGAPHWARRVRSYSQGEKLGRPWRKEGDEVAIQFSPGVVRFENLDAIAVR